MTYHLPAGKALGGPYVVEVTPETAGWGFSSLRILELPPGGTHPRHLARPARRPAPAAPLHRPFPVRSR
jgi:hypothetical protein